jgi:Zn-dependent M28 family amino/carboxypeptidase
VIVSEQLWTQGAIEGATLSFNVPAPIDQKALVKNVIGILRGSDPALKSTCVMLTAHYDHIGTVETGAALSQSTKGKSGDLIYNGANDDGSGTVSVVEIARAISQLNPRPKRSIVFMTFFGEERGELGSQYYGAHPVFPIDKTVADVNLEQVGRTDSTVGKQLNNASLTGFDYSTLTKFFEQAGRSTGIKIYKDAEASDAYFTRSDNAAMAEQGVPAHTLTVAFDYPDYHALGDEWQKVDYANMAKVDRMIALGLVNIANSAVAPEWNAKNPKTAPFREAQQKSRQH